MSMTHLCRGRTVRPSTLTAPSIFSNLKILRRGQPASNFPTRLFFSINTRRLWWMHPSKGSLQKKIQNVNFFQIGPDPPPPWNLNRNFWRKKFQTDFDLFTHFTYKLYKFWYFDNVFSSFWLCQNWVHLKILPYFQSIKNSIPTMWTLGSTPPPLLAKVHIFFCFFVRLP